MAEKRDLQELEDALWEAFDHAKHNYGQYHNPAQSGQSEPGNFMVENRKAMGELAQGIAAVRREMRIEQLTKEQQLIEDEMDKGLKSGVTPLNPIKLKSSGTP
jgi:hypothetical protein